jgi:hypothetical protein
MLRFLGNDCIDEKIPLTEVHKNPFWNCRRSEGYYDLNIVFLENRFEPWWSESDKCCYTSKFCKLSWNTNCRGNEARGWNDWFCLSLPVLCLKRKFVALPSWLYIVCRFAPKSIFYWPVSWFGPLPGAKDPWTTKFKLSPWIINLKAQFPATWELLNFCQCHSPQSDFHLNWYSINRISRASRDVPVVLLLSVTVELKKYWPVLGIPQIIEVISTLTSSYTTWTNILHKPHVSKVYMMLLTETECRQKIE